MCVCAITYVKGDTNLNNYWESSGKIPKLVNELQLMYVCATVAVVFPLTIA